MTSGEKIGTWLMLGGFVLLNAALVSGCMQTDSLTVQLALGSFGCVLWAIIFFASK